MKKVIITLYVIFFTLNISYSQTWSTFGSGLLGGQISQACALAVYNNDLIAGGQFNIAGGVSAKNIAKWNGTNWSPLGSGLNYWVKALLVFNGYLIAGGYYSPVGGDSISGIAKWNGSNWSNINTGVGGGTVFTLTIFNNELIAGGNFTSAGGVNVNNIAKWNGTTWTSLGSGIGGLEYPYVLALVIFNNELIVGGQFTSAGGVSVNSIAKWNGTNWTPLGSGVSGSFSFGSVRSLAVFNNELIVGGYFSNAGGVNVNNIAKWNGTNWSLLSSGVNGEVYVLTVFNNQLIAGGNFISAGGVSANRIAKWDGITWLSLGSGVMGGQITDVLSLKVYNNGVVAGGDFEIAGSIAANRIARWGPGVGIKILDKNVPEKFSIEQNYPNPFNPNTIIRFQIKDSRFVTLKIYNSLGEEITALVNEKQSPGIYEVNWNAENYPSGVYYYTLSSGDFKETKRMVLVK